VHNASYTVAADLRFLSLSVELFTAELQVALVRFLELYLTHPGLFLNIVSIRNGSAIVTIAVTNIPTEVRGSEIEARLRALPFGSDGARLMAFMRSMLEVPTVSAPVFTGLTTTTAPTAPGEPPGSGKSSQVSNSISETEMMILVGMVLFMLLLVATITVHMRSRRLGKSEAHTVEETNVWTATPNVNHEFDGANPVPLQDADAPQHHFYPNEEVLGELTTKETAPSLTGETHHYYPDDSLAIPQFTVVRAQPFARASLKCCSWFLFPDAGSWNSCNCTRTAPS
jgi:hypothetical protein